MSSNKVTIIIVTYNNENTIKECINSIPSKYNTLIIDNNSTDKTLKNVQIFKNIKIIKNNKNYGFAKAVNQGISSTLEDVFLLNPDTVIQPDTINVLQKTAYDNSKFAGCGPRTLNSNKTIQPNCGNFPNFLNILTDKIPVIRSLVESTQLIRKNSYYREQQEPDWISGASLYIKRSALKEVGLFDEDFFMYLEEVDWFFRANKKGYKAIYCPKTSILHRDEGRNAIRYPYKFYNIRKGILLFLEKNNKHIDKLLFKTLLYLELNIMTLIHKNKIWEKVIKESKNLIYKP